MKLPDLSSFDRLDFIRRKAAGAFGAASTIWKVTGRDYLYLRPRLIRVDGGFWIFVRSTGSSSGKTLAALVLDGAGPKPVEMPESGYPGSGAAPAAWAVDDQQAGFVTYKEKPNQLNHCATNDRGATWEEQIIPFSFDAGSNLRAVDVFPVGLARQDKRLALLVNGYFTLAGSMKIEDAFEQCFSLVSEDLGQTWGAPQPAASRLEMGSQISSNYGILAWQKQLVLCHDSFQLTGKPNFISVRLSEDHGKTWFNQHAFDALSSQALKVTMGGDSQSLHVACMRHIDDTPKPDEYRIRKSILVIRSFTRGDWKAPEHVPAWFKEEKLPEPTREEF